MPVHHHNPIRVLALVALTATLASAQGARSPRADLSVTPAWLAEHLKDPDLVLLHVGEKAEYDKGHIPGARFVTMEDLSVSSMDHEHGLMLELPPTETLRAHLAALGISDKSRVVVYYGNDWISPSTRILFTLDYAGLGDRSTLLDGGMPAWKEAGHPLSADVPTPRTGQLAALKTHPIVVSAEFVKANLKSNTVRVLDGRAATFFDGADAGNPRKGHIAGARSLPFTEVTDDKLRLKSAEQLAALFTKAGVGPRDTVVAYCHIGQQATAVLFAARTLGHPVLLYDGAFQEWSRRSELPVENPAESTRKP
ncbi:MAG: rhodanese-like domain-containing protein [bacterium]